MNRIFHHLSLTALTIILPFTGPLNAPLIVIIATIFILFKLSTNQSNTILEHFDQLKKSFSNRQKIYGLLVILFSCYSIFLGTQTSLEFGKIPLLERYGKLPYGIYHQITHEWGISILLAVILINLIIIKKTLATGLNKRITTIGLWLLAFGAFYILLLPLGGYRPYRPNIVRNDTFIPITICLIYFFAITSFVIQKNLPQYKAIYALFLISICVFHLPRSINNDLPRGRAIEVVHCTYKISMGSLDST
ncbi:MAG: hypothetical protein JKY42_03395 [Flavobacteriales bacterium]|nr:hypothetical protein [Flavobacteriales bacterium]